MASGSVVASVAVVVLEFAMILSLAVALGRHVGCNDHNGLWNGRHYCRCLVGHVKGTGTRDLIWLKVVSLDRSWLVGLTDDL